MNQVAELSKSRATLNVIQFLNREGETKLTGLIGKVAGQKGVYSALDTLLKFDLVKDRTGKEFPHPRLISLTDKGKEVADCLNRIEKALDCSSSFTVNK